MKVRPYCSQDTANYQVVSSTFYSLFTKYILTCFLQFTNNKTLYFNCKKPRKSEVSSVYIYSSTAGTGKSERVIQPTSIENVKIKVKRQYLYARLRCILAVPLSVGQRGIFMILYPSSTIRIFLAIITLFLTIYSFPCCFLLLVQPRDKNYNI